MTLNGLLSLLLGVVLSLLAVNEVEALGLEELSDSSGGETSGDLLSLGMALGLAYTWGQENQRCEQSTQRQGLIIPFFASWSL